MTGWESTSFLKRAARSAPLPRACEERTPSAGSGAPCRRGGWSSPDSARDRDESLSRALPEVPEMESDKEGRRGGFATRADTTPPRHVGAASEKSENPSQIPSRLAGRWIGSPSRSSSSPSSGRRPSPLRGRIRRGFPVLRVEWPGPWKILVEKKTTSRWWSVFDHVRALLIPE